MLAVRWYLRFALSYRDVEELLADRGIDLDHTTVYRWVQRFTPLLAEAGRPCRHAVGDRWQVDETYVKVAGRWRYVYRAIDQFGQVVDVFVAPARDLRAARRFFERATATTRTMPSEVETDQAPTYPGGLGRVAPGGKARHRSVRQQQGRVRPRPPEGTTSSDARAQAGPQRPDRDRRPRLLAEHPSRALRAGGSRAGAPAHSGRVSRAHLGDLTPAVHRHLSSMPRTHQTQQCRQTAIGVGSSRSARRYLGGWRPTAVPSCVLTYESCSRGVGFSCHGGGVED
jgi:transposase-like protein